MIILVTPLVGLTLSMGGLNVSQTIAPGEPERLLTGEQWYLYPVFLRQVLTLPVLILAAGSIIYSLADPERRRTLLFVAWLVAFYITFVYIAEKIPRYAYFWIPPFTLFAALIVRRVKVRIRGVHMASAILIIISAYQFTLSFTMEELYIKGYDEAAEFIAAKRLNRVFYHGSANGNGNFIFDIRRNDPERRAVVVRGDKVLASSALHPDHLLEEHATNAEEIRRILDDLGLNYFVIDKKADFGIKPYVILREVLKSDDFVEVKRIPIESNYRWLKGEEIVIYRRKVPLSGTDESLRLKLPIVGTEITTPLKQLNNFYTPSNL
jgi:hypothetical protein